MPGARRTLTIPAPINVVYDVISDYAAYPEFLDDVATARVVSRSGSVVVVEFSLKLMGVGYTLRMTEDAPDGLRWTLEASKVMKANMGGWALKDLGDGTTEATYDVEVTPRGMIPGIGRIVDSLTSSNLPKTLQAFTDRCAAKARTA